jgi:hypothetical protein
MVIENLLYVFKEETKFKDNQVTIEGATKDFVYILKQGELAVLKNHNNQP